MNGKWLRGWVTYPRSHSWQVAFLRCAPCVSRLSIRFFPAPSWPKHIRLGRPQSFSGSSVLCDRFVQALLARCSDGELMARFGLFMSVDLLSLPAPPDSTVSQDVGGGQGGGQPVSLPLSTPTLMHLPLQSGRVWGDPTQHQAASCPFVSLS